MRKIFKIGLYLQGVLLIAGLIFPGVGIAKRVIKIGAIYPLSGPAANVGRELRAGAELSAEIANTTMVDINMGMAKNRGIASMRGAKIEIIFKDHHGNPSIGEDMAKILILDEKVDGLMGCYHSSVTKAVSAVAEQYGVPMINATSYSPVLTRSGFKWFWRITPHDKWYTKDLFELIKGLQEGEVRGIPKIPPDEISTIASACEKTEWGSNVASSIRFWAKQYGIKVDKSLLYTRKSDDLSNEVRSLKAGRPGAMLFASNTSDAILLIKTLKALNAKPRIIWGQAAGFGNSEFRETLGDSIVGILTPSVFLPKIGELKPLVGQANKLYRKKTGNDLGTASARTFTGLQTWVHVLELAGSAKPLDIQQAINTISIPGHDLIMPWTGVQFSSTGDEIGQNVLGSGLVGQYQKGANGEVSLEIIYPFDLATAEMIYPYSRF
jgi:branched-chain amino acid transport system substrate-binding protein